LKQLSLCLPRFCTFYIYNHRSFWKINIAFLWNNRQTDSLSSTKYLSSLRFSAVATQSLSRCHLVLMSHPVGLGNWHTNSNDMTDTILLSNNLLVSGPGCSHFLPLSVKPSQAHCLLASKRKSQRLCNPWQKWRWKLIYQCKRRYWILELC
jgi:hypothetical protein